MNIESFNDFIECMSLKGEIGNWRWHSLKDGLIPAAYAIHGLVSKVPQKAKIDLKFSYMTHNPGFLSFSRRKEACFN